MFHDIYSALKNEIKNIIFKSWFHFIRFGGLMLIPLIYGFSYIFAFYNPFPNINNVQVSVITGTKEEDPFGYALGESLKNANVKIGDLEMTLSMEHILINEVNVTDPTLSEEEKTIEAAKQQATIDKKINKIEKESYATIEARGANGSTLTDFVANALKDMIAKSDKIDTFSLINSMTKTQNLHFQITPNFKKNYLIAFGVNIGTSMQGTYIAAIKEALETLKSPDFLEAKESGTTNDIFTESEKTKIKDYVSIIEKSAGKNASRINPINLKTNMAEHNKYGFGLAPFFISVAMWIGGMTMTFAVHRKIYDKEVTPGHRYFAKWILIVTGTTVQATILMFALYLVGFKELGISHWGSMYGFTIIIGMVFASLIQALRFTIHSRNLGIFVTIIILVAQMASAGGLFPIETQSWFYKALNTIMPMSKSVNIIRETAFDTDWGNLFTQLGYLLIYLLIVPFAVVINHYRTVAIYLENGFKLPKKTKQWIDFKKYKKNNSKKRILNKKASKKGGK